MVYSKEEVRAIENVLLPLVTAPRALRRPPLKPIRSAQLQTRDHSKPVSLSNRRATSIVFCTLFIAHTMCTHTYIYIYNYTHHSPIFRCLITHAIYIPPKSICTHIFYTHTLYTQFPQNLYCIVFHFILYFIPLTTNQL